MRSLYFLLASVIEQFRYLKLGLAFVLVFVGGKMVLADLYEVPVAISLAIIGAILLIAASASLIANRRERGAGVTKESRP